MDADVIARANATTNILLFSKGDRLNLSPEYTAGASLDYAMPLGSNDYQALFSASANYSSTQTQRGISNNATVIMPGDSMTIGRVSLGVESPHRWTALFYVDNINDEQGSPTMAANLTNRNMDTRIQPRTIGLQFEYQYGK